MSDRLRKKPVGSYLLILEVSEETRIEVGRLGSVLFKMGTYVYTGSAKNGLLPRLERHFSKEKKLHWHIDYLLTRGRPLYAVIFEDERMPECVLNRFISDLPGSYPIDGFGCSDCDCMTHLHRADPSILSRIEEEFPDSRRLSAIDFH